MRLLTCPFISMSMDTVAYFESVPHTPSCYCKYSKAHINATENSTPPTHCLLLLKCVYKINSAPLSLKVTVPFC